MVALGGLLVVIIAGGVLMLGLLIGQGWLTVLGMLLLGVVMVAALARASRRDQEHG